MIYAFGNLEWDEELFELRERDAPVAAPPRVLDTLAHLIRNRERAVPKEELLEVVWKGVSVSDASLSQAIMVLRKAVGDEGDRQQVIKTVRGRGFRFIAPVLERTRGETLRAARSVASSFADHGPELVGRAHEEELLSLLLCKACAGRGSMALVEGEPGIGKSALVERLAEAAPSEAEVYWGRGWEEGGAPAFWPWIQVLRDIVERHGTEVVRRAAGKSAPELLALATEPGRASESNFAAAPNFDLAGAEAQFKVFDSFARLFRAVSRARPLLVILEDLHAADEPSLKLLRFLSQAVSNVRLLIVGTFRDLEVTRGGPAAAFLCGPLENTHRVALGGLPEPAVSSLLEVVLERPVAERLSSSIHRHSGGNPFLVLELARLAARGKLEEAVELTPLGAFRVPERAASAVRRRIAELPDATRALLCMACVAGREFELSLLGALSQHAADELLRLLGPALKEGLLSSVAGAAGSRLQFSHALVRSTLYGDLEPAQRVLLHRRIGETLERCQCVEGSRLDELAHHFFLAAPGGSADKAIDYALRAAHRADEVCAFESSGELYDRCSELAARDPDRHAARYDLLMRAGHAWYRAGKPDIAIERFDRAAALASEASSSAEFGSAVMAYARARSAAVLVDRDLIDLIRRPRAR